MKNENEKIVPNIWKKMKNFYDSFSTTFLKNCSKYLEKLEIVLFFDLKAKYES
jgi:hypothetical protein